jgi:hypothetical protein
MFELAPKTRKLLDLFVNADYGDSFTYGEILQATGCDLMEADRQRTYTVVRRLERDHEKTLLNQRGVGYKVANPNEHVSSMMVRKGRAGKQIQLARRTGSATPVGMLSPAEVTTWVDAQAWMGRAEQIIAHHDRRIDRLEARLDRVDPEGAAQITVNGTAVEVPEGS